MNKRQKLVQEQFLNDEEKVIKRLNAVYKQSLSDVNDKVKNLSFQIGKLQKEYDWLDPNDPKREKVKSMIQSKIYQKQYQEQLHKQLDDIVDKIKTQQFTTVSAYLNECYTNGVVGTVFDLHGQGVPVIMPIDQKAMVRRFFPKHRTVKFKIKVLIKSQIIFKVLYPTNKTRQELMSIIIQNVKIQHI